MKGNMGYVSDNKIHSPSYLQSDKYPE